MFIEIERGGERRDMERERERIRRLGKSLRESGRRGTGREKKEKIRRG